MARKHKSHTVESLQRIDDSEAKLAVSEERLRLALEAGEIGVWDWNIDTNSLSWSEQVYYIHGVDPKKFQLTYENYRKYVHPEDKVKTQKAIEDALKGEKPYNIDFRIITPDKHLRWVSTSATVLRDKSGKPIRMLGATSDVTDRKELERKKDEFLAIASHELKTPVTSIKAYGQVLQKMLRREGNVKAATHLEKMDAQIDKLTNLIGDLLDVTKIQSGKLQFNEEEFDFNLLVKEIVEEVQRTTEKHQIKAELVNLKFITGDKERIGQVLTNLLTNAIKYSPHSQKINVSSTADSNCVTLCVRDYGVGIPKENQTKVFEQFYRVSGPGKETFPGLGLGLYITSEIIKRQGGRVWVESEEGKGSTFCFTLPLEKHEVNLKVDTSLEEEIRHE